MARKTKNIVIPTGDNRDAGKAFVITEKPALAAERWALRALQALAASDVEVPEDLTSQPLAVLASVGLKALAKVPSATVDPLLADMMECVRYVPNPKQPDFTLPVDDDVVEEVTTLLLLRKEALMLHLGFFTDASAPTTA